MTLTHPDLAKISGDYDLEDARRLRWPIAWSGAPDTDYEDALNALAKEITDLLEQTPDAVSVTVLRGEVVSVEIADDTDE